MANKTIYTQNNSLWSQAAEYAEANNLSVSQLIERALESYLAPKGDAERRLEQVRKILAGKDLQ